MLLAVAAAAFAQGLPAASPSPVGGRVLVLLADNRLAAVERGEVVSVRRLAAPPVGYVTPARLLLAESGGTILLLFQAGDGADAGDGLAEVDPGTLEVRRTWTLPAGVHHRGILQTRDGRIYAYGNRFGRVIDRATGWRERSAVLTEIDLASGAMSERLLRPANHRDWWVYAAALDDGARRLVVADHGGCTATTIHSCT